MFVTSLLNLSIYFGCTHADFISLSHSRLLAMTGARSCLERPVPLSSWLITVVAGRPLERLPCFGSQRSSWETVSLERSFKNGESSLWFPFSFFSQCSLSSNLLLLLLILFSRFRLGDRERTINSLFTLK